MPTKEEILETSGINWLRDNDPVKNGEVNDDVFAPVFLAMEEYAKQEALEFNFFFINNKMKYLGEEYEYIYYAYQKSKTTKQ